MHPDEKIIIIGGGLSGLTLAYLLSKKDIETTILEASPRIGGRIQTVKGTLDTPLELGATWFSDLHQNLITLLDELELQKYHQYTKGKSLFETKSSEPPQEFYIPASQSPSYRISGGTQTLTDTLFRKTFLTTVKLNTKVTTIKELESILSIETSNGEKLLADRVIICLPPQLAGSQIKFSPALPDNVMSILPNVQTWMAGNIKFVLEYDKPFWRTNGHSGMLFSHIGVVTEMHDHTNFEENKFGFTGFLNSGTSSYSTEERKGYVLAQLEKHLGPEASKPLSYFDKVWTDEFIVGDDKIIRYPHQNNGHPIFDKSYLNGKLLFSGTESSAGFSGYMEGAITSAQSTFNKITS